MTATQEIKTGWLFLSFWHIVLDNLPEGDFRHQQMQPNDAAYCINQAQSAGRLFCVSKDDLLAPYRKKEQKNHQELCEVLRETLGISLSLRDFCTEAREAGGGSILLIQTLALAQIKDKDRLMVVTCNYKYDENLGKGARYPFRSIPSA